MIYEGVELREFGTRFRPVSSPLCDAWVCVKPRLALPALRGFR